MPSVVTYPQAIENLRDWLAALSATSGGSSYSLGGRTLTRQDTETIRAEIRRWHNTVTAMEAEAAGKPRALGSQASFPTPGSGAGGLYPDDLWTDYRT